VRANLWLVLALAGVAYADPPKRVLSCDAVMDAMGSFQVRIAVDTQHGTIYRVTAGKAFVRDLRVIADDDGTLRFDGYGPKDSTTVRGERRPRPAGEKLVRGKTSVGRLVTVGSGKARFYVDGGVDWTTDSRLVVHDGYADCITPHAYDP
jgi:hypothetical protein